MEKQLLITPEQIQNYISDCQATNTHSHYDPYYDEESILTAADYSKLHPSLMVCHDKNYSEAALCLNNRIIAFASDFSYYEGTSSIHEIFVLTVPEYRNLGLGKELVNLIAAHVEESLNHLPHISSDTSTDVSDSYRQRIFLVGSCDGFAKSLGAIYSHSEHFMKLDSLNNNASIFNVAYNCRSEYVSNDACDCNYTTDCSDTSDCNDASFVIKHSSDRPSHALRLFASGKSVCRCHIDIFSDSLYISKVYTNHAERGHGYAGELIKRIRQLYPDKYLFLQVSGNNKSAVKCYLKAGFTFYETTDYYEIIL